MDVDRPTAHVMNSAGVGFSLPLCCGTSNICLLVTGQIEDVEILTRTPLKRMGCSASVFDQPQPQPLPTKPPHLQQRIEVNNDSHQGATKPLHPAYPSYQPAEYSFNNLSGFPHYQTELRSAPSLPTPRNNNSTQEQESSRIEPRQSHEEPIFIDDDEENEDIETLLAPKDPVDCDFNMSISSRELPLEDATHMEAGSSTGLVISRETFIEHNAKCTREGNHRELWTKSRDFVYHSFNLFHHLEDLLDETLKMKKYDSRLVKMKRELEKGSSKSLFYILQFRLPQERVEEAKSAAIIGRCANDPEELVESKVLMQEIIHEMSTLQSESESLNDLTHILVRIFTIMQHKERILTERSQRSCDPNERHFPIPMICNPDVFRMWVRDNCDDEPSRSRMDKLVLGRDGTGAIYCLRNWIENWETFDFSINGEAAWMTLPQHVIKEDLETAAQTKTWRKRSLVPDCDKIKRMLQRRDKLRTYFLERYSCNTHGMGASTDWAETMEANWAIFQGLCADGPSSDTTSDEESSDSDDDDDDDDDDSSEDDSDDDDDAAAAVEVDKNIDDDEGDSDSSSEDEDDCDDCDDEESGSSSDDFDFSNSVRK